MKISLGKTKEEKISNIAIKGNFDLSENQIYEIINLRENGINDRDEIARIVKASGHDVSSLIHYLGTNKVWSPNKGWLV